MNAPDILFPLLTALLLPLYLLSSLVLVADPRLRMSPLPVFAGMWLIFYLVYLIGVSASSFAAIYVLGLLVLVNLGAWFGHRLAFPNRERTCIQDRLLWPRAVVWATVLLGAAVNVYLVMVSGVEISGPRSLLALPDWYSSKRYQAGEGIPFPARVANALTFAGTMVAAVIFVESWRTRRRVAWAALLPGINCILYGMIIGSKAPIIYTLIYYLNGFFAVSLYHGVRANPARLVTGVAAVVAAAVTLAIIAQYFRAAGNQPVPLIVSRIATSYFIVPPALLIEWLGASYREIGLDFNLGVKTFQGISSYFVNGIGEQGEMGYVVLFGREYHSSVYTALRWIITDYGFIGAPLIVCAGAIAFGRTIKRLAFGDMRAIGLFLFIGNLLLFSFAGSPYKYTSHVVSIILVYAYITLSCGLIQRKRFES